MNYDVIIIGGGPAGLTCALYCSRAGLKTLVLEKMFYGGQAAITANIENYPGFKNPVDGSELAGAMREQAGNFGTEFLNVTVSGIDPDKKTVITSKGEYSYKALVVCTGAIHRKLGVEGEEMLTGSGVSHCATCDGGFFRDKTVCVAGGGNTAFEDALYLSKICSRVYIIHRRSEFRASAALVKRAEKTENIEFITDSVVSGLERDGLRLSGVRLENLLTGGTEVLRTDGLFVAVGMLPESGLLEGIAEINKDGYVVVGKNMSTTADGIFAAGDVTDTNLRQIVTAAADGARAAAAAEQYISMGNLL